MASSKQFASAPFGWGLFGFSYAFLPWQCAKPTHLSLTFNVTTPQISIKQMLRLVLMKQVKFLSFYSVSFFTNHKKRTRQWIQVRLLVFVQVSWTPQKKYRQDVMDALVTQGKCTRSVVSTPTEYSQGFKGTNQRNT